MCWVIFLFVIVLVLVLLWVVVVDWQLVVSICVVVLLMLLVGSEGEVQVVDVLCLLKCGEVLQVQFIVNIMVEVSCLDVGGWCLFVLVKVCCNQIVLVFNCGIGIGEIFIVVDIIIVQCDVVWIVGVVLVDFNVVIGCIVCCLLYVGVLLLSNDLVVQCFIK